MPASSPAPRPSPSSNDLFRIICSSSVGLSSLDRSVCEQNVLTPTSGPTRTGSELFSMMLAPGSPLGRVAATGLLGISEPWSVLVRLHRATATDGKLDPAYDPRVDGCVLAGFDGVAPTGTCAGAALVSPLSVQAFTSELAALSFNFLSLLVGFSTPDADAVLEPDELDPTQPRRVTGCSFVNPGACREVARLRSLAVNALAADPRTGLQWIRDLGSEWEVTAADGDLAAHQGRSLLAYGPWDDGAGGAGLAFVLVPEPSTALSVSPGVVVLAQLGRCARRSRFFPTTR